MKKILSKCDKTLLIMMIIYSILGLVMIFSSSSVVSVLREGKNAYNYVAKQAIFLAVTYSLGFILIIRVYIWRYTKLIMPALFLLFVSLIVLLFAGAFINGSKSWFSVFGLFNLQPSEFVKTAYIMYVANFFYKYQRNQKEKRPYYFLRPLIVYTILAIPILKQPDLGTAVVLGGIAALTVFLVPYTKSNRKKIIVIYAFLILLIGSAFYFGADKILSEKQMKRLTFKDACKRYTDSTGYQVCNSLIAINNGGLKGTGLGNSTQKYMYLPAAHTDFAFSIVIEEFGAIVSTFIIIGYAVILYRIYKIARNAYNLRNSIIAFAALVYMAIHIFINLYGVMGTIPLTGIPLPFISYGGSFNVNLILLLFLVLRVSVENSEAKIKKEMSQF